MTRPSALVLAAVFAVAALAGCTDGFAEGPAPMQVPAASSLTATPISDETSEWEPSGAVDPTNGDHYVVAYRSGTHTAFSVRVTFDAGVT